MKYTKKLIAMLLAVMMVLGAVPSAFAADINEAGSTGTVPVQVSAAATTFSVGLPTSLPVCVSADHNITTANDVQILNNCYGMVNVKNVDVTGENNWELVSFNTDFRTVPVDVKQFGMTIQEAEVSAADGSCDATAFESIVGYKDLSITYDAVVAVQSEAVAETIANVVFTIGWDAVVYTEFAVTSENRAAVGYTGAENEHLVIPATFVGDGNNGTTEGENYKVTSIGNSAFQNCSSLTNVTIPDSVTSIEASAFRDCSSLTNVTIGNGVTSIGGSAFQSCGSLTSVNIPDSVTSIGGFAFYVCSSLTSINYDGTTEQWVAIEKGTNWDTDAGDYIVHCTDGCMNKTGAVITCPIHDEPAEEVYTEFAVTSGNRAAVGYTGAENENLVIPATFVGDGNNGTTEGKNYKVTSIRDSAFSFCSNLTSITIPDSVTSVGLYVFNGCTNLLSVVVDENNTVYDSRNNCNAVIETATNTLIAGCKNTVIPDDVTSISSGAFRNHYGLTSITIPDSVTSIGSVAFDSCDLVNITIPDSVTSIGKSAFGGTSKTSIVVDENNPVYDSRNNCNAVIETATNTLIFGCVNTTIPDGVTSIADSAFSCYCSPTTVVVPEGVIDIGDNAFSGTNLKNITIPNSIVSIGAQAFWGCSGLTSITFQGTQTQWDSITKGDNWDASTGAYTIHCTDGDISK